MKKLLTLAVLVAAGVFAYNYFINVEPASAAEREIDRLEERFEAAKRRFTQAGRSAAVGGLDTTAEIESARLEAERIDEELRRVMERVEGDQVRKKAKRLEQAVQQFRRQFD